MSRITQWWSDPVMTIVLLLGAACQAAIAGPAPGLYRIAFEAPGEAVQRTDTGQGTVYLRERLTGDLRDAKMASGNNDNSRFHMTLTAGPVPAGSDIGPLAVVIGEACFPIGMHSNRGADGCIALGTLIDGRDVAMKVATTLQIQPWLRTHPGHQFVTSVRPAKASYAPQEPVTLIMTIQNVGKTTIQFDDGGRQRGPRNNQFSFTAFQTGGKAVPDTGDPTNFGGPMQLVTLAPGEAFTK